jgi:DNA-binding CsgD family transcriptional regulator
MAPILSPRLHARLVAPPQPVSTGDGSSILPSDVWLLLGSSLRLSARELQIVQEIFAGHEQETIAQAMGISPDLVYRTTQRIHVKLRTGSRAEIILKVRSEYLALVAHPAQPEKAYLAG